MGCQQIVIAGIVFRQARQCRQKEPAGCQRFRKAARSVHARQYLQQLLPAAGQFSFRSLVLLRGPGGRRGVHADREAHSGGLDRRGDDLLLDLDELLRRDLRCDVDPKISFRVLLRSLHLAKFFL